MVEQKEKKDNLLLTPKIKIPILDNGMYGDSGRKEERSRGTKDWQVGSLDFWWSVYSFSTSFFLVYRLSSFFSLVQLCVGIIAQVYGILWNFYYFCNPSKAITLVQTRLQ